VNVQARDYLSFAITDTRSHRVCLDHRTPNRRNDMSIVNLPTDTVGYTNGKGGAKLRQLEQEQRILAMWVVLPGDEDPERSNMSRLALFGCKRGRRAAELMVMRGVETKHPGFFVNRGRELKEPLDQPGDNNPDDDWGYDTYSFYGNDYEYFVGAYGELNLRRFRKTTDGKEQHRLRMITQI